MTTKLKYRSDIDGLRAVAVVSVVFFHAGDGFPGGYVGVDIFFVISGFLITSLILKDLQTGRFSIIEFWERRARRIIPAMAFVMGAVALAGWLLLLPEDFVELGQSMVAQSAMLSNIHFWREAGYFAGPSELKPLLHCWSLAVEEQFYLIIAPLAFVLFRAFGRFTSLAIAVLIAFSFVWSIHRVSTMPDAAFFLLPSRAWELLLGSFMALHRHRAAMPRWLAEVLAWSGAGAIFFAVFSFDDHTPFPGVAALAPCLGAAALIWSNEACETLPGRILSLQPLVFVGLISYSLYLWHWPLFAFANYLGLDLSRVGLIVPLVAISFSLATLSWRYVETPFRKRMVCASRLSIFTASGSALAALALAGFALHFGGGFRPRFSPEVLKLADGAKDKNPRRNETMDLPLRVLRDEGLPRVGDRTDTRDPILLVIGDSHGDALLPAIDALCEAHRITGIVANRRATIPIPGAYAEGSAITKRLFHEIVVESIESTPSLREILLIGRWNAYSDTELDPGRLESFASKVHDRGIRLWIFRQVPEPNSEVPRTLALAEHFSLSASAVGLPLEEFVAEGKKTDALFNAMRVKRGVRIVDPRNYFYAKGVRSLVAAEGRCLFYDDDHLSSFGALQLIYVLEPVFLEFNCRSETSFSDFP